MTDKEIIQVLQKDLKTLRDALHICKNTMNVYREDMKDLQRMMQIDKRRCPALVTAQEEIDSLKKRIRQHEEYERNSLLKEPTNAPD
jgi:predicted RNase H-like nuclease (RuvC/YqgF family)